MKDAIGVALIFFGVCLTIIGICLVAPAAWPTLVICFSGVGLTIVVAWRFPFSKAFIEGLHTPRTTLIKDEMTKK